MADPQLQTEQNDSERIPPSEREAAEHLLLLPEERIRLIEENVRDYAIFVVAPDGHIASWNVGAERMLGYAQAEAIGMDCVHIFLREDQARGAVEHERQVAHDIGRCEDERWHIRKDGTCFWGSGIMTGLRDQEGQFRGYVKILRDMTAGKLAEVQHQEDARQIAAQEHQAAILDERNRMAREIHDTLAQGLTGIAIHLEAAEDTLRDDPQQTLQHISKARQLARDSLTEARRSVLALRPQALDHNTLPAALQSCIGQVTEDTSVRAVFNVEGEPYALLPEQETDLLRIGQEGLTNALKHAQARSIRVCLSYMPGQVQLHISDDGRGFDPMQAETSGRFGLLGMRERVTRQGGSMQIISAPGDGARLVAAIPILNSAAHSAVGASTASETRKEGE